MRRLLLAFLLLATAPLRAAPAGDFHKLLADHYQWLLRENPVQATALGVRAYDDQLADPSLAADDRRAAEAAAFLARLEKIPSASLSSEDRTMCRCGRRRISIPISPGLPLTRSSTMPLWR
jgi:uncharacterized protein (DUF885 family)